MARSTNLNIRSGVVPLNAKETDIIVIEVASAYGTDIVPGDPVIGVTTGGVQRTPAGTNQAAATDGITGVCLDIVQYKDPAGYVRRNAKYLPANTTWTAHHERSLIKILLANENHRFLIQSNAAVASLTVARALRFANCEHVFSGADTGLGLSGCKLAVAGAATTAFQWRVIGGFADMPFNDPTVTGFALEVMINKPYALPIIGESTTGV